MFTCWKFTYKLNYCIGSFQLEPVERAIQRTPGANTGANMASATVLVDEKPLVSASACSAWNLRLQEDDYLHL
jgi:hypothetical protein